MDFFDKVGDAVAEAGEKLADKAKEAAELVSLKSQITTCEEVIRKNYVAIGKLYYEKYRENPEELFEKQCRAIGNAQDGIVKLRERIDQIKGI